MVAILLKAHCIHYKMTMIKVVKHYWKSADDYIDGLAQNCSNSIANAL